MRICIEEKSLKILCELNRIHKPEPLIEHTRNTFCDRSSSTQCVYFSQCNRTLLTYSGIILFPYRTTCVLPKHTNIIYHHLFRCQHLHEAINLRDCRIWSTSNSYSMGCGARIAYTRAAWKFRGLTLFLRLGTLWKCGDGLFFEVPPLASDILLTTLHPLLENVLQTVCCKLSPSLKRFHRLKTAARLIASSP
jgi:hypothetical protein